MDFSVMAKDSARSIDENSLGAQDGGRVASPRDSQTTLMPMANPRGTGFTLIELLVCVAILTVLISLLLPSLNAAREQSRLTGCAGNLHGLGQSIAIFASQNDQQLPPRYKQITSKADWYYPSDFFQQYNWDPAVFAQIYGSSYQTKNFACPANINTEVRAPQMFTQDGISRKIPWAYQYYGPTPGIKWSPWAPQKLGATYDGELSLNLPSLPPPRIEIVNIRREDASNMPLMSDLTMRSLSFQTNQMTPFNNHSKTANGGQFSAMTNVLLSDGSVVTRLVSDLDQPFLYHNIGSAGSSNQWLYYYR